MKHNPSGVGIDINIQNNSSQKNKNKFSSKIKKTEKIKNKKNKIVVGILDKIIALSLFMLFFGVPLFFTGLAFQGIVFEKQIYFYFWTLLAVVVWVFKGVFIGEMKIRKTPLDIPIIIFSLIYAVATFFSIDRWHSFWGFFGDPSRGFISIMAIVIVYYLIVSNCTVKKLYWMIGGLIVSNLIITAWSLLSLLKIDIIPIPDNLKSLIPLSLIGTMAGLKLFTGMMIPIITATFFKLNEHKKKLVNMFGYLLLLLVPANLFLILILPQRVISLIILVGVGFFLLYILANIIRLKKNLTWIPMFVFILVTVILIIGNNNFAKVTPPVEIVPDAKVSWEVAKESLKNYLFIGSGPASYGYSFSLFKPQSFNDNIFYGMRFYQGSGLFFEALSTVGLLGTISLLIVVITFINVAFYLITKGSQKNKIYSLGLLSSLIIFIIGSFFVRVEGTILILGGILGGITMATILRESNIEGKFINLSLKTSPKFALTLAFVFIIVSAGVATLFVYIGKAYVADIYAGKGARVNSVSENDLAGGILRAISLNPKEGRYYSRAGQEYMLLANEEAVKSNADKNANKIKDNINKSLMYANMAVAHMPKDALSVSVLAQINESLGLYAPEALNSALDDYKKLSELEPHNPIPFLKIGQIKIAQAMSEKDKDKKRQLIEEAKKEFQKTIAEKKNLADSYYYMALSKNALDDKDGAIDSMTEAVKLNQNNIVYLFNLGKLYQDRNKKGDLDDTQKIFEYLITVNPDDISVNFALALLYEKKGEKEKAINEYNKTIELVSKSKNDNRDKVVERLKKMIENVKNGVSNESNSLNGQNAGQDNNANNETKLNDNQKNASIQQNEAVDGQQNSEDSVAPTTQENNH